MLPARHDVRVGYRSGLIYFPGYGRDQFVVATLEDGATMADKSAVKSSKQSARTLVERRAEKRAKAQESTEIVRKRKG